MALYTAISQYEVDIHSVMDGSNHPKSTGFHTWESIQKSKRKPWELKHLSTKRRNQPRYRE